MDNFLDMGIIFQIVGSIERLIIRQKKGGICKNPTCKFVVLMFNQLCVYQILQENTEDYFFCKQRYIFLPFDK